MARNPRPLHRQTSTPFTIPLKLVRTTLDTYMLSINAMPILSASPHHSISRTHDIHAENRENHSWMPRALSSFAQPVPRNTNDQRPKPKSRVPRRGREGGERRTLMGYVRVSAHSESVGNAGKYLEKVVRFVLHQDVFRTSS